MTLKNPELPVLPGTIYLVPDAEHGWVWCDDPAPGEGMDPKDAMRFVRAPAVSRLDAEATLQAVRNALELAYNAGVPVCCQRPEGAECCGAPEPEWPAWASQVMAELGPIEKVLAQALSEPEAERSGDAVDV